MDRILVVDDDRKVLEQVRTLLSPHGYEVAFIAKAEFLFPRLESESFDLILLDINMPGANGIELLKQLKSDEAYKEIPVIMNTGEDDDKVLVECFNYGAADYITKPIKELVLRARISASIAAHKIQKQQIELEHRQSIQSKLKSLSSQMNPHFIFNSLNSVQYYILENETEQALSYISCFASLMRKTLENSTKDGILIEQEVEFLSEYLELESQRFKSKFEYTINCDVDPDDEIWIPPMLIQPYVENAVVHGFDNVDRPGILEIEFKQMAQSLICRIEDNGIGRKKAQEKSSKVRQKGKSSLGMSITQTRLLLLNDGAEQSYNVDIHDKYDGATATGTLVTISIPIL